MDGRAAARVPGQHQEKIAASRAICHVTELGPNTPSIGPAAASRTPVNARSRSSSVTAAEASPLGVDRASPSFSAFIFCVLSAARRFCFRKRRGPALAARAIAWSEAGCPNLSRTGSYAAGQGVRSAALRAPSWRGIKLLVNVSAVTSALLTARE